MVDTCNLHHLPNDPHFIRTARPRILMMLCIFILLLDESKLGSNAKKIEKKKPNNKIRRKDDGSFVDMKS